MKFVLNGVWRLCLPLLFVAFSVVTSTTVFAALDCNCGKNDPFAPSISALMPAASILQFHGACQDTCIKRSAHKMKAGEYTNWLPDSKAVRFSNLAHDGDFWFTRITKKEAPRVILMVEHFPVDLKVVTLNNLAGHDEIRFHYSNENAATLVSETNGPQSTPIRLRDFVYSAEYSAPKGIDFDLQHGLENWFAIVYRFVSLEDKIKQSDNLVEQWELLVTPAQRIAILRAALKRATSSGMQNMYNTLNQSCVTEAFAAIKEGVGLAKAGVLGSRANFHPIKAEEAFIGSHYPLAAEMGLRGLGIPFRKLKNLSDEGPDHLPLAR